MVFQPALTALDTSDGPFFGPTSFRDYVAEHDLPVKGRTPRHISVDTLSGLAPELTEADVMVLRMGSAPSGTGTQFLLVQAPGGVEELFLVDEELFDARTDDLVSFASPVEADKLLSFRLLPNLSETSMVNLALASGILGEALDLDREGALMPPATGLSTFTFDVRPHSAFDGRFTHRSGQVEIDTLFAERRSGETALFVIEAKVIGAGRSLAKHKLMYPLLALAEDIPERFELIPVYLRVGQVGDDGSDGHGAPVTFHVAECTVPDPRDRVPGLDELTASRSRSFRLKLG